MGIVEILILVALAIIIFLVIRRLPDTRVDEIGGKKIVPNPNRGRAGFSGPARLMSSLIEKLKNKIARFDHKKTVDKHPQVEELKKTLKKPEDRDFWIEGAEKTSKPDLIAAKTYFDEAEAAFKEKDYSKAEKLFVEAARENPKNVRAFNRLGAIYLEQKNFEDAIEAFSTAIKYDDTVCSRFYNLALAYIGQGNYKEARKNLKNALKLSPDNEKYKQVLEQIEKKC